MSTTKPTATERRPLSSLVNGERTRILGFEAGRCLTSRLTSMGLRAGAPIEVINNTGYGPVVVAVYDTRIMLGRGMAHHIFVE